MTRVFGYPKSVWTGLFLAGAVVAGAWFIDCNWAETNPWTLTAPAPEQKALMMDADLIRVGISDDGMTQQEYPGATISANTPYRVLMQNKVVWESPAFVNVRVSKNANGFFLRPVTGTILGPFPGILTFEPKDPQGLLRLPGITRKGVLPSYRGKFEIMPAASSLEKLSVVNVLPMQEYLKAVVPNELPYTFGYEAVKAQAVAARNYAIHPREKPWKTFDICDSQYCQAYYGAQTEHPQTSKALEETQGLIALYQGEPILALYSSSAGGYRENYEYAFSDPKTNKFPGTPIPYLRGGPDLGEPQPLKSDDQVRSYYTQKQDDNFDVNSPTYRWQRIWTRGGMEVAINKNLAEVIQESSTRPFVEPAMLPPGGIGTLKNITILERGVSGKAMRLSIESSRGKWILTKEFVIRKVLKNNDKFLPSANMVFDFTRDKSGNILSIKASGGGLGHGVGMSQYGASFMSKNGKLFDEILKHYYQGIDIGTIPLTATATQGMKTTFYAPVASCNLFVKSNASDPLTVFVNNQRITIKPGETLRSVNQFIVPGQLNEFRIEPVSRSGEQAKAWIVVNNKS